MTTRRAPPGEEAGGTLDELDELVDAAEGTEGDVGASGGTVPSDVGLDIEPFYLNDPST